MFEVINDTDNDFDTADNNDGDDVKKGPSTIKRTPLKGWKTMETTRPLMNQRPRTQFVFFLEFLMLTYRHLSFWGGLCCSSPWLQWMLELLFLSKVEGEWDTSEVGVRGSCWFAYFANCVCKRCLDFWLFKFTKEKGKLPFLSVWEVLDWGVLDAFVLGCWQIKPINIVRCQFWFLVLWFCIRTIVILV